MHRSAPGRRRPLLTALVVALIALPALALPATAAGLGVTGYHFARPDLNPTDAKGEADWFAGQLALAPGMLVPALDLEVSGGMSTTALRTWVGTWLAEVAAKTGVKPMIYTSPSF